MTKCLDISLSFCFVFVYHHPSNPSIHCIASQSFKQSTSCAHAPKISHGGSRAYRPVNSAGMNKTARFVNFKQYQQHCHCQTYPKCSLWVCAKVILMCLCVFSESLISASRRKLLLCLSPVQCPGPCYQLPDPSAICTRQRTVLYHRSLLVQSTVLYKCIPLPDLFHRVTHVIQL